MGGISWLLVAFGAEQVLSILSLRVQGLRVWGLRFRTYPNLFTPPLFRVPHFVYYKIILDMMLGILKEAWGMGVKAGFRS